MNPIGRKIYYEISTGNVIVDTGDRQGGVVATTIEQDYESYIALSERNPSTVGVLELEFGQYAQDFAESSSYRVNPTTKEVEFSYPNPDETEAPQVFRKPLSEEVERLKAEDLNNKEAIAELYLLSMGGF
ncbi:hypothetical protein [Psychrobacillus sp. FSL K6-1415]|uniref:hypothetical protein n=1 Tax=Psychrobacillus sp. FSL K6-1415 TaxID=2921544 RepID=UPI0030F77F33